MSDGLLNALYIIPILAVLILVHEFGHFFAARAVGAKVEEFGIGIPPRAKGWEWKGVLWSLNWIPFGGFVRVLGEDGKNADPGSMNAKSPAQRAFFLVAGSVMNVLLALVLIMAVVGFQGVPTYRVYIGAVSPGSPAADAGWNIGDRIIEAGGAPVEDAADLSAKASSFAGQNLSVVLDRGGERVETIVVPRENPPANEGRIGVSMDSRVTADILVSGEVANSPATEAGLQVGDRLASVDGMPVTDGVVLTTALVRASGSTLPIEVQRGAETLALTLDVPAVPEGGDPLSAVGLEAEASPRFERVPAAQVIPRGLEQAWEQTTGMLSGLRDLVTGRAPLGQIAGPIGMGQIASEFIAESSVPLWVALSQLSILLSLNLAILNLLPLPALDGGRLFFVLVEVLRGGKRIPPEREGVVHLAGMVVLIGVMFVVAFFDVGRIISGESILP